MATRGKGRKTGGEPPERAKEVTEARLRAFLRVIDVGPAGAAGEGRAQEQLRLVKLVTQLETAVGEHLFGRRENGQRDWGALTPVGAQLAGVARNLADLRRNVRELAARGPTVDTLPRLRLQANESLLLWRVLPALARFDPMKAGFRLELTAHAEPVDEVAKDRCDIAVSLPPRAEPEGLVSERLGRWTYAPFVPAGSGHDAASLRALRWVSVASLPEPHDELAGKVGPLAPAGLQCHTFAQAARLVASGRFAAVLPVEAGRELGEAAERVDGFGPLTPRGDQLRLYVRQEAIDHREAVRAAFDRLSGWLAKAPEKR